MRKVTRKPASIPETLHSADARAAKEALASHFRISPEERARRRPPLNSKIWSSELVRARLTEVFHRKCAYCETPLSEYQPGDVSHHRPTGQAAGISERVPPSPDHYSWFAYEWENLFLACPECNRAKRNLFPVDGPRAGVRSTWLEAEAGEQALIINPCRSEPRKHLRFFMDGAITGVDDIGRITIEALSLDRPELTAQRARKFERCLSALERGRDDRRVYEDFRDELLDHAPFAGAARIAFFYLLSPVAILDKLPRPLFKNIIEDAIRIATTADGGHWAQLRGLMAAAVNTRGEYVAESTASNLRMGPRRLQSKPRTSQLRHIRIQNFKGISRLELEMPSARSDDYGVPCMMLLGENSTGKSSTLQAVALALMSEPMRARMGVSPEDFLPREVSGWQLNDSVEPEVTLEFDTGEPISLRIDPMTRRFIGEAPDMVVYAFGARRYFGKESAPRPLASTFKSLFDPFAKLGHPGRWLEGLGNNAFDALARAMREVLVLQAQDAIGRDEHGRLFVRAHGRDTPLERLSDGYRSLMAMVLDIARGMIRTWGDLENARGLVLIDEIETHLHPRWKLRVVSALRRAMPNVQFIATTHDPLCLRGMRSGEVQVLVRNDDHRIDVLSDLPDVRGLRAEQLLTSDYFGLSSTADPDVEAALQRLALPANAREGSGDADQGALRAFKWLGDTPFEQVVHEALRRFVAEASEVPPPDRGRVREEAVNDVLARLRAMRVERRS